jgi:formamidopyrimidine-DNA glycosylase
MWPGPLLVPELPEVETLRRDLEQEFAGRRIVRVEVSGRRSIRRHPQVDEFAGRLRDRRVEAVGRRGKYLLARLDGGDVLVVHLGMSGQLLRSVAGDPVARHTHVVMTFAGGRQLRFVDPRTFGELFVSHGGRLEDDVPELAHLGLDPLDGAVGPARLGRLLLARRAKLKPLLMDQRVIVGIGNIYADEILFAARLRHDRSSASLTTAEIRRLHRAITRTLEDAIALRGSSLADLQYRDLFGETGGYRARHHVYGREGEPCTRCAGRVARVKTNGRSTFFCPRCQGATGPPSAQPSPVA